MQIKIKKLRENATLPEYQTIGAAGFDFHAAISKSKTLKPNERLAIPTGLAMEIPEGFALNIYSRSGLSLKYGITMVNGVGLIDSDYRGEIHILLTNHGGEDFIVEPDMRIAQGVIFKYELAEWSLADELDETERNENGFGSTGE